MFGMGTGVASSPSPPKNRYRRYDHVFGGVVGRRSIQIRRPPAGLAKAIIVTPMQSAQFECRIGSCLFVSVILWPSLTTD